MDKQHMIANDNLSFKDQGGRKHGLRGHVSIYQEDPVTKKLSLWDEADNIIPISGYQWILMKMFNLFLDSRHYAGDTTDLGKDTTVVIPDLNNDTMLGIGTDPTKYTPMQTNIAEDHFIQGFMVGNGASTEDLITAKNTDYSFVNLRNPIPFQQTQSSLDPEIAGQYLGVYRTNSTMKSYFIKKFDKTPHIVHSWWKSGQTWDYVDPVTQDDLGPNAANGSGKTNRIETYASCSMTIDNTDFQSYFENEGNTQSAVVNELGLVAFNSVYGTRTIMEKLYENTIKPWIDGVFGTSATYRTLYDSALEIQTALTEFLADHPQTNISAFLSSVDAFITNYNAELPMETNCAAIREQLVLETNIQVEPYYNYSNAYVYSTDKFLEYLHTIEFTDADEAQRIKLITYYTFKPIPVQTNTKWVINYRIYSN